MPIGEAFDIIDEEADESAGDIIALRNSFFWRWFGFAFGCLGSAAKLFAISGEPSSKAYGVMYLTSFFAIELLMLVSWIRSSYGTGYQQLSVQGRLLLLGSIHFTTT